MTTNEGLSTNDTFLEGENTQKKILISLGLPKTKLYIVQGIGPN